MKKTKLKTQSGVTLHAFSFKHGHDRRTLARRIKVFQITPLRTEGTYAYYDQAELSRVMKEEIGDDDATGIRSSAQGQPGQGMSKLEFAETFAQSHFEELVRMLPEFLSIATKGKLSGKECQKLAVTLFIGFGHRHAAFIKNFLEKKLEKIPVPDEIKKAALEGCNTEFADWLIMDEDQEVKEGSEP